VAAGWPQLGAPEGVQVLADARKRLDARRARSKENKAELQDLRVAYLTGAIVDATVEARLTKLESVADELARETSEDELKVTEYEEVRADLDRRTNAAGAPLPHGWL
jgi:alkanesulfonate monooxygenase SsuD/methylene tetrahydromethanopterin reductase-like flavin-dependent oxidoreductase (luciferase family)